MARTLKLVDSEAVLSDINLISPTTIQLSKGGFGDLSLDGSQVDFTSPMGWEKILETYKMSLYGSSQDNAASQLQALNKMLRKAAQYFKTPWQSYPIYLQEQQASESGGSRYAIVFGAKSMTIPDVYDIPFEVDSRIEDMKLELFREHPWRAAAPGALPSAITLTKTDGSVDLNQCILMNEQHTQVPSHIYAFDASGPTFSGNLVSSTSAPIWSVGGSTPAAGDMHYVGWATRPGHAVCIPIATAGVYTADVRVQAYISGAWTDLVYGDITGKLVGSYPGAAIGASSPYGPFTSTGENLWVFVPLTWQTVAINGVTDYWIRFNLNAVSSWTTTPVTHATQTVYGSRKPYFDIPNTTIGGDAPPRFRMDFSVPYGGHVTDITKPCGTSISRIIVGAKSTNKWLTSIGDFTSRFNLHQYGLPGSWARALGTDTTEVADTTSPEGYKLTCSFGTDATMLERITLTGTGMWPKYKGSYRVFLHAAQLTGAVGDVKIKLRIQQGGTNLSNPVYDTDPILSQSVAPKGYEVFDFGLISIPFNPTVSNDNLEGDLIFTILAQRLAGASSLDLQQLIFIPVDEWYTMLDDPQKDANGSSALRTTINQSWVRVTSDFGILANRAQRESIFTSTWTPTDAWHRTSSVSRLQPARAYRFFTTMMEYNTAFGTGPFVAVAGSGLVVQLHKVDSFTALRGAG